MISILFIVAAAAISLLWFLYDRSLSDDSDFEMIPQESTESSHDSASASQWNLLLVNRWNAVPEGYEPDLVRLPGGEKVDRRVYEPLTEMLSAAEAEGLKPVVVSGYRTYETQEKLFRDKMKEYRRQGYSDDESYELAAAWVQIPGYSEHQLGLAADINGESYDIYLWLQENSYKYGFIFRYPADKTSITGVSEEVWHYRYVGTEAATEMYRQGLCLEEYLAQQGNNG